MLCQAFDAKNLGFYPAREEALQIIPIDSHHCVMRYLLQDVHPPRSASVAH